MHTARPQLLDITNMPYSYLPRESQKARNAQPGIRGIGIPIGPIAMAGIFMCPIPIGLAIPMGIPMGIPIPIPMPGYTGRGPLY